MSASGTGGGETFLPHGFCFLWNRSLLALHVGSDALIGASYVAISAMLIYMVWRGRREIPFHSMFVAFGLFIVACGATHFMEIWTLWQPVYWLSGAVKVVTAGASVATAVWLPFVVPTVLTTVRNAKLSEERRIKLEAESAANRAKSEFLAVMSHELRTPLNAIIGYTDLLGAGISGPVTDNQAQQLGRIKTSARHLVGLIDEILTFSRLEAGREEAQLVPVDIGGLVNETVQLVEPLALAKGLRVVTSLPAEPLGAESDPAKLRQILFNLLSNAVKFTDRGTITIATRRHGPGLAIEVSDTGIGIPSGSFSHIFQPFWQADQSPTRRTGGTGLGLSVSRQLAHLLGGEIGVESRVGEGSTFRLVLPLVARSKNVLALFPAVATA